MRSTLMIVLVLGFWTAANAQDVAQPVPTNADCVQRLEMPSYSKLALAARIQGAIATTIKLSSTGSLQTIMTERHGMTEILTNGLKILVPSIEEAIKKSVFRSDCAGKTVRLVFRFEIKGAFREDPTVSFAFSYPNEFWISTPPLPPMIN
jgi:hypothetical protein